MKKILISLATASLLLSSSVYAKTSKEVSKETITQAKKDARSHQVELVQEAVKSLLLTQKVLLDLDKKDTKTAIKDLEDAIGKLEVILANKKAPKLLPVDSKVTAIEYIGDLKKVKSDIALVKTLLADGKVQDARKLLNTLQSQINILTISIPLVSYPDALKLSAKYLHDNKIDEARAVLETALSTLVEERVVLPIPILKAEGLIKASSLIAKSDKKQALKHLDQAKKELEIAKTLGYVSKSDTTYKMLDDAINDIEKEIKGKNKAEKMFEALISKIKEFKEKAIKTFDKDNKEK
jgi:tetratricopeptide (TPR) repeat protein